jgi:hypothetical protein
MFCRNACFTIRESLGGELPFQRRHFAGKMQDALAAPDEAIEIVRGIDEHNAWTLDQLLKQLQGDIGITPFIGAGLTKPFGYPLWGEFLLSLAKPAGLITEIEELLSGGSFEEAAEALQSRLGKPQFDDRVCAVFDGGRLEGVSFKTSAIGYLPHFSASDLF